MEVSGTVALITGGGGGIGAGIAEALAEKGAKVAITDIDPARADVEAARIGHGAIALPHDVTSPESWAETLAEVESRLGPVDVLCNNAGISQAFKPLIDIDQVEFARLMAINVTGVFNGIRAVAPGMVARGRGHIVNTSSMNGLLPHGTFAAYTATKFAVAGMSEALAQELGPSGVGVSILYPGLTRSYMSEGQAGDMPEDVREILASRMMEPLWLGRAVARAIEENTLHIISHPAHEPQLSARFKSILDAHGEPAQPGYEGGAFSGE